MLVHPAGTGPETTLDRPAGVCTVNAIRMKHACLLIVVGQIASALVCALAVPSAPLEFSCGPTLLSFDENNGDLTRVACQEREIARAAEGVDFRPPFQVATRPTASAPASQRLIATA